MRNYQPPRRLAPAVQPASRARSLALCIGLLPSAHSHASAHSSLLPATPCRRQPRGCSSRAGHFGSRLVASQAATPARARPCTGTVVTLACSGAQERGSEIAKGGLLCVVLRAGRWLLINTCLSMARPFCIALPVFLRHASSHEDGLHRLYKRGVERRCCVLAAACRLRQL